MKRFFIEHGVLNPNMHPISIHTLYIVHTTILFSVALFSYVYKDNNFLFTDVLLIFSSVYLIVSFFFYLFPISCLESFSQCRLSCLFILFVDIFGAFVCFSSDRCCCCLVFLSNFPFRSFSVSFSGSDALVYTETLQ